MVPDEKVPRITVDHRRCTGCRICEQICVFFHEREFNPRRSRIKILMREKDGVYAPLVCNQCRKCLSVCNQDAISWDDRLGFIRVDAEKCNGCGLCIESCPEGAITLDPVSGIVNICDLCQGEPRCVAWCTEKVLLYEAGKTSAPVKDN